MKKILWFFIFGIINLHSQSLANSSYFDSVKNDIEKNIQNYINSEKFIEIKLLPSDFKETFFNNSPTEGGTQGCNEPAEISAENLSTDEVKALCLKNQNAIGVIEGGELVANKGRWGIFRGNLEEALKAFYDGKQTPEQAEAVFAVIRQILYPEPKDFFLEQFPRKIAVKSKRYDDRYEPYCFNEYEFRRAVEALKKKSAENPDDEEKEATALTKTNIEKQMRKETQLYKPCKGFYTTLQENFRGTHEVACEFRGLPVYGYGTESDKSGIGGNYQFKINGDTGNITHADNEETIVWDEDNLNESNNLAKLGLGKVITINANNQM